MRSRSSAIMIVCAVLVAGGLAVAGFVLGQSQADTSAVVAQIQKERTRNSLLSCQQTNKEHAAIIGFVTASIPAGHRDDPQILTYLERADQTFPQRDCAAVVRSQVKP